MNKKMEQLRKEYQKIPIPDELDNVVNQAIHKLLKEKRGLVSKYTWFTCACTLL